MTLLREAIKDSTLRTAIESLWQVAQKTLQEFQEGTTGQGTNHCLRVEDHIWSLIQGDLPKFSPFDLFLLSASAALHDIGKIEGGDSAENVDHGELAKERLMKNGNWKNFVSGEKAWAEAMAYVISVHSNGKIEELPEEFAAGFTPGMPTFLRSLAAIFRLADMLDSDYRRCPYLVKSFKELKFSEEALKIWTARSSIHGWKKSADGKGILLQASPESKEDRVNALAYVDSLNQSLTEPHKKYLENCPIWNPYLNTKEILHFPTRFFMEEFERGNSRIEEGLVKLYTDTAKHYLMRLAEVHSDVDLRGIGDFSGIRPTKLSRVFVNVNVALDFRWKPDSYVSFDEKTAARIERNLTGKNSMPVTDVMNIQGLKRIVLLGEPGSGKTTICQYFCLNHTDSNDLETYGRTTSPTMTGIPLLVTIRELVSEMSKKPSLSIVEFIYKRITSYILQTPPLGFVEFWLRHENSLTIFDGLDEVIRLDERMDIRDLVTSFVKKFPEGRFLVTSRMVGYEEAPLSRNDFLHLRLQKLEDSQIENFIRNWYNEREANPDFRERAIKTLIEAVNDEHVRELAQNILLLTMMAIVHGAEADLPKQRARLYEKCVEAFLVSRNRIRDLLSYNPDEIRKCHEYLGYWMHTRAEKVKGGISEVPINELRQSLIEEVASWHSESNSKRLQEKVDEFIDASRKRVGLIVERGPSVFAFGHRSFEEYFAAKYISQNTCGIEEIFREVHDKIGKSHWLEVLKLLAGIYGDSNRRQLNVFVQRIFGDVSDSEARLSRIILAGEIAGDKVPINAETLTMIANELIQIFLNTQDSEAFNRCHEALEHLFNTPTEKYMIKKLREIKPRLYMTGPFHDFWLSSKDNKVNTRIARIIGTL